MNGDTVEQNAKDIVEIKAEYKGVEKELKRLGDMLEDIWERLREQGDVRKDLDKHTDSHWKMTALIVTAASIAVGSLTAFLVKII